METGVDRKCEEPVKVVDILGSIRDDVRCRLLSGEFSKCPHLTGAENHCERGKHSIAVDKGAGEFPEIRDSSICPVEMQRIEARRRRDIIAQSVAVRKISARYGIADWNFSRPLWSQLLDAIDRQRPVRFHIDEPKKWRPLGDLIELVRKGCQNPSKEAPHLMLWGPCGTGKTSLQAVLYLAAAEAEIDAIFLDSIEIRTLVVDLASRYSETQDKAERAIERLLRRDVIFWSDVGDTNATRKEFAETIATLLERFMGRLVTSSNLSPMELEKHPDIGQRAVSRMMAVRNGRPAIVVTIDGKDQRRNGMQSAQVNEL